jgi:hypothetical protein
MKYSGFARMNTVPFSKHITAGIDETQITSIEELIEVSSCYDCSCFPFLLNELPGKFSLPLLHSIGKNLQQKEA